MPDWDQAYRRIILDSRLNVTDCDASVLARHVPLLERLDAIEGSSVVLYDLQAQAYRFMTPSFKFLAGLDRNAAAAVGPDYFFQVMRPAHVPFVKETVARAFRFLEGLPPEHRKDWKLAFEFDIARPDGVWVCIMQQVVVLELDAAGRIWLVLIANDLAPSRPEGVPPGRQLRHLRTGAWQLFPPADERAETGVLSRRELEVLGLVAGGLASRDIADRLCISVATVNNHRQHILEKLGSRTSAEAVRQASALGLI